MNRLPRLLPDSFTLAILGVVVLALMLPCSGEIARLVAIGSDIAIALLFFLQGARLSRPAVFAGILHWRLHLIIVTATFVVFPLLGLALRPLSGTVLAPPLYIGLVFLCTLPSAVQASVIFTSIAGGNVPAALCSASLSSVIGMVLTPLLVGLLLQAHGGDVAERCWIDRTASAAALHRRAGIAEQDRRLDAAPWAGSDAGGSRFGPAHGLWCVQRGDAFRHVVPHPGFKSSRRGDRRCGAAGDDDGEHGILPRVASASPREDEIAIVFCGSKKSLVTGIPMANALFAGASLGLVVLPLMIFHQLQLMACATLARRYALGRSAREIADVSVVSER